MVVLPDVNVLLPLIYDGHLHHAVAVAWLDTIQQDGVIVLCRASQLGLLRLLNNPVAMGADVQNGREVWETWDALIGDARFRFADEPEGLELYLRSLSSSFASQPKRWQDAWLAAFALAVDAELVTFDKGFRSFPNLRYRILSLEGDATHG